MPEQIELIQAVLGLDPYVLIECKPDDDPTNEAGFLLKIRAGGGVSSQDDLVTLLLSVVEESTGVAAGLYVQEVNTARRAAGSAPLGESETPAGVRLQGEDHGT